VGHVLNLRLLQHRHLMRESDMEFRLRVDVYSHDSTEIASKLDAILRGQNVLYNQGVNMSKELDALEAEVTKNTEVDQSAITLLTGLAGQIAALKNDPVKLQALADSLKSSSKSLADAVAANTPAENPTPVDPIT
jgi:chromosome segregation ATPase